MAPVLSASAWVMLARGVVGPRIDTERIMTWARNRADIGLGIRILARPRRFASEFGEMRSYKELDPSSLKPKP